MASLYRTARARSLTFAALRLLFGATTVVGCGGEDAVGSPTSGDGGLGLLRVPDGGYRPADFECPDGRSVVDLPDAVVTGWDATTCIVANPNVRFSVDVAPILGSCSGELCHDAWKYSTTVGIDSLECCERRKLIEPGRPAESYLLQKLMGREMCGNSSEMPPGVTVPQSVIDVIAGWVCLGAPDN